MEKERAKEGGGRENCLVKEHSERLSKSRHDLTRSFFRTRCNNKAMDESRPIRNRIVVRLGVRAWDAGVYPYV